MTRYCWDIVRRYDPDRYLLGLMMPAARHDALFALFAFNYEIAKTREVVSETQIGLIRLQWWREAIAEIYEGRAVREHEVVRALAGIIHEYDLPREDFDNLIYAREFDLEGVTPSTIEGFFHYCDFTTTPLNRLAVKICGESESDEILKSVSVRYAVSGLLRAVPYMRIQRRVMLPQDILAKNNLSVVKIIDFNEKEKIVEVVKEVLENLSLFRYDETTIKSRFLRAVNSISTQYANQISEARYDVFDSRLRTPPAFFALKIWFNSRF